MNTLTNSAALESTWPIPMSWYWAKVGHVGNVMLGRQRSPINHNGPLMRPYLRAANVTWAGLNLSDVKAMNFDARDFERFELKSGDVLLNEGSGSPTEVGKSAIWNGEIEGCCFQNTLLRFQPRACTSEFAAAYFRFCALTGRFAPASQGVNIAHLGKGGLANFQIPLAPLAEQRRIVAKLDALTARTARARADLDRVAALAAQYRLSILDHVFAALGSVRRPLIELVDRSRGIPYGIIQTGDAQTDGIPTVRCGDIKTFKVHRQALKLVKREIAAGYERTFLRGGEVLIAIRGTVGHSAVAGPELINCNISREVAMVPVNDLIIPEFLMYFIGASEAQTYLRGHMKGVAQSGINLEDVRTLNVPVPPRNEQTAAVARIEGAFREVDRLTAEAAAARRLLERLDQAILSKAFRGELVPQDPADEPASVLLERIAVERAGACRETRRGRRARVA